MSQAELRRRTRERILEGAVQTVARHGLAKLEIADVSRSAGVSRGTVYRYFASREELLDSLAVREADRFWRGLLATLEDAPADEERIRLLLQHATRHVRRHPVLQRLLETDPALVLRSIQERFPSIRDELHRLLAPLLEPAQLVQSGVVSVSQLVDLLTRLLISAYLIPPPDGEEVLQGFAAIYRVLAVRPEVPWGGTRPKED